MKTWWLALVVCAGCATENRPDIDATGTVSLMMTYGGGNCAKTGKEPFTMFLAKRDEFGGYDITQSAVGQSINGNVVCGSEYCSIDFFKNWQNNTNDSLSLDGDLSLDGHDLSITGNGKYSVFGSSTDCDQVVTYAGSLQ